MAGLAPLLAGCGWCENFKQVSIVEPLQFHPYKERRRMDASNEQLAECVLAEMQSANPAQIASEDYVCGFKDGFLDYRTYGASAPPALPPRQYWRASYRTPVGDFAVQQWFAGFQDGAAAAHNSYPDQTGPLPEHIVESATHRSGSKPPVRRVARIDDDPQGLTRANP